MRKLIVLAALVALISIWLTNRSLNRELQHRKLEWAVLDARIKGLQVANKNKRILAAQKQAELEASRQQKIDRVKRFLGSTPYAIYAPQMVDIASAHHADFRLFPAIVMAESTGGRQCRPYHNCIGFSAHNYAPLGSPVDEINFFYNYIQRWSGKTPVQILIIWNGRSTYSGVTFYERI